MSWNYEQAVREDASKVGYTVSRSSEAIVADGVPYRQADGHIDCCRVIVNTMPDSDAPGPGYEGASHTARVENVVGGILYNCDGSEIGNRIRAEDDFCILSIKKGDQGSPESYDSAWEQILKYIYVISEGGAVDRAQMKEWRDKLADEIVGIVGVGGTGSYILDLVSKSGISRILIWDSDVLEERNTRRGVGSVSYGCSNLGRNKAQFLAKQYDSSSCEVIPYPNDFPGPDASVICDLSFVFIAVDEDESRTTVRRIMHENKIPYIDVGMGVRIENGVLTGSCQAVLCPRDPAEIQGLIPEGGLAVGKQAYRNLQVSEVHALNAALAVVMWRRFRGQYPAQDHLLSRYSIDWNTLAVEPAICV